MKRTYDKAKAQRALRTRWPRRCVVGTLVAATLAGCVRVNAPDRPIEINLNISIKQEVVYRLDQVSKDVIKQQPGIF